MAAFSGFLFLITLYLQEVRGYRPLIAGLFLLPMAVAMAVSAPLCGRMLARSGPRLPLVIAGIGITIGGIMLVFITGSSPVWYVLASCLVLGIGMGWVNAPITNSAVAGMPRSRAGTAAGIASTSRQVGSSLGVAVVGSVLTAGLHGSLASGFASATRPAWWLVAAMGAVVLALALVTTGRAGRASAARTAELIETAESRVPAGSAV
jgi:MFS family permease